jgi:hypothetical protein
MINLLDLGWLIFFVGGGMLGGRRIVSFLWSPDVAWGGTILGGALGYGLLLGVSFMNRRELHHLPPCYCGYQDPDRFTHVDHEQWGDVYQCRCTRMYVMRKGYLWYECVSDGSLRLQMKRGFWGTWKSQNNQTQTND